LALKQYLNFSMSAKFTAGILAALSLFLIFVLHGETASGLSMDSARDCDNNAVIMCGALSTNEIQSKYNSQSQVQTVFHNFGITHIDVGNLDSTAVSGKVTKGGRVLVGDTEVATGAMTAGMQNITGSQKEVKNGVTYYVRSPSVSFNQSSLPAFVVMKDGQFAFAVIASCGNPVKATPVAKKIVQPAAQPVQPAPPPAPPQVLSQSQSQEQNVTVVSPQPSPVPAPTPVPQPAVVQQRVIPNTGAGSVFGLGALVAVPSSIAHYLYRRNRIRT
jgi:hypothetical protein